jgi:hypothetical protein
MQTPIAEARTSGEFPLPQIILLRSWYDRCGNSPLSISKSADRWIQLMHKKCKPDQTACS